MSLTTTSFTSSCSDLFSSERYEGLAHLVTKFWLGSVVIGSRSSCLHFKYGKRSEYEEHRGVGA